jgi:hypothetical protein
VRDVVQHDVRGVREGGVSAREAHTRVSRVECGSRVVAGQRVARRHPVHVDHHVVAARRARVRQGGGHPCKAVSALCLHPVACPWPWRERGVGTLSVDERAYTARSGGGCCGGGEVHVARRAGREGKRDGCAHGAGCQRWPSGRRWVAGAGHTSAMRCAVTAGE